MNQIFEDYGDNGNALYLEAHGFVPFENPFNCADLSLPISGSKEISKIVKELQIMPRGQSVITACLKPGERIEGNTRSYAYLAVLDLGEEQNARQRKRCLDAITAGDRSVIADECVRYDGHYGSVHRQVDLAAKLALNSYLTTFGEDREILATKKDLSTRVNMAVRYRMDSKRLLLEFLGEKVAVEVAVEVAVVVPSNPRMALEKLILRTNVSGTNFWQSRPEQKAVSMVHDVNGFASTPARNFSAALFRP